jgi:hypothetical protein
MRRTGVRFFVATRLIMTESESLGIRLRARERFFVATRLRMTRGEAQNDGLKGSRMAEIMGAEWKSGGRVA